ncbi:MAG: C25 family cysteine peptidase [Candidatus Thermoplasmatota archaeon]|nr:C25 family cysteine peptidase [Candidatus Thermoplasmatota archaeon]
MKAKIVIAVAVVAFLIGTAAMAGFNTSVLNGAIPQNTSRAETTAIEIHTAAPTVKAGEQYLTVHFDRASSTLRREGYPMLPFQTQTLTFPLGTTIEDIEVHTSEEHTMPLHQKIAPAPTPLPLNMVDLEVEITEGEVYGQQELFPAGWVEWHTGGGIRDGQSVTFLTLRMFPARYAPAADQLHYVEDISVEVRYREPQEQMLGADAYDLVIIAPSEFVDITQELATHKQDMGLDTLLVTLDEIYGGTYFPVEGRDGAEKIKYFLKNAIEEWGIEYALLMGGKKSYITGNWGMDGPTQVNDDLWHVPVRYAALDDQAENGYLSDLYFADIYNADGSFSSWDTNDDGVYGAWAFGLGKDVIDGYPDLYVGRLACRSTREVRTVVDKIITYESTGADPSWFNRVLLVGGDTFPRDDIYEGEVTTEHSFGFMPEQFEATRLFTSDGSLPYGEGEGKWQGKLAWMNVIPTMSEGYGFVAFDGHGSPTAWATHFPGNDELWVNGLMTYNMDLLSNGDKLPVLSVGGCHNSEFNISLLDFVNNEWTYQPTYECWSWHLVKMRGGGSIATLGYTGLGYGAVGDGNDDGIPDTIQFLGGFIEGRFFKAYGQDGVDMLGATWAQAITEYNNHFPPMEDRTDTKTIEEWCLLGDPSLKIGGY